MSAPDSSDSKRVLYLEQIDIETQTRAKLRIKLQKDKNDVEIQRKGQTSSWIPSRTLELFDATKITINARTKLNLLGQFEPLAEINGEEAMQAFWDSQESVSCTAIFNQRPVTIMFHFRPSHTSETMRMAVQNLQTTLKDYKSLMKESTEQRIVTVIKFGVVLAEMNPFAKLAFGLAKGIFDLLKQQRRYDENVSDLASGIDGLLPFANRALEGVLYEEELLDGVIRRLYDLIGDTANFVISYAKRGPASRVLRSTISPKDSDKIKALYGDFGTMKEELDRAVDLAVLMLARRNEESGLLKRLKLVEAANYEDDHGCMEGTRTQLLNDIVAWTEKPFEGKNQLNGLNPNVFWLYGMPGLGKTSVANSLCDRLRRNKSLGGSFFCKHDNPDLRAPRRVLPTLIAKLARMWGPFRRLVAQVLLDEPQINPESSRGELLLKPLQLLKKHPPHSLVLVIDALDECGQPRGRSSLLDCLTEACSLVHWLKVVVTSRPERDIESFFNRQRVLGRDLATDDLAREGIRLFTERRMVLIANRRHLSPHWPGTERVSEIVERSDGLFIFVETLYQLVDVPEPKPVLAQVLCGESQGANTALHQLYSMVLRSRIAQPTDAFHSILRAIIAVSSNHPLCDEALAELIGLEPPVVRSWVDELSSLLYRDDSKTRGIRVRHLSILEFLVGSSCPAEFRVDLKLSNSELALYCLRTMAIQLKFNICELETSYLPNVDIQDLSDRVEQGIADALRYSCMHWSNHLCYDVEPVSIENNRLLDGFFAESLPLYWLEVLSLMGKVPVAISALRRMKSCFKKFEDRHRRLAEDALRFVLAFFTPISTSTPHIYISALPFMPMESSAWTHVGFLFPETINVREGRMKSWPAPSGIWHGHTAYVRGVAYSPDGQNVVSGAEDMMMRLWDVQTGAAVGEPMTGHTGPVWSVAYSPDGYTIVSGSEDQTIRMWDAHTGAPMGKPMTGHTGPVWCVAYSPDSRYVASGSKDKTVRIWDAQTGAAMGEPLMGHTNYINSVAYSPDGRNIVSGAEDNTIRIWDAQTGEAVGEPLTGHTNYVWGVAYSPDSRNIVSSSADKTIRFWDAQTGAAIGESLIGHTNYINSVVYSPDGQNVVSASDDHTIRIWDVRTRTVVGEPLTGHAHHVRSVAYSPDGRNIVSGSSDNTIRIWDAQTGKSVGNPLTRHAHYLRGVAYSPDGHNVVSASSDNTIRIRDTQTGSVVGDPLTGHTSFVWSVAYSPCGCYIASGSKDKTIRIWDAQTGAAIGDPLKGHTNYVESVAYSPNGQKLVSGSDDNTIRIWDMQTREAITGPLIGHTGAVWSVAYSSDGLKIVSGSKDMTIRVWDAKSGAAMGSPLRGHTGTVRSVAYSPDGRSVVSGSHDTSIQIWDVQAGEVRGEPLTGHTGSVWSVAYSPDGLNIISGSEDQTIRIWDAQTGATVKEPLTGHTGPVWSVAYSPDGLKIVSGSKDTTIRVWDAQKGVPIGEPLAGHTNYICAVAYSPNGRNVVSGSEDHTTRIWEAQMEEMVGELRTGYTSAFSATSYSPDGRNVLSGSDGLTTRTWDAQISMEKDGHGIASIPSNSPNSYLSLNAFSGRPIPAQLMDSNGWVRGADGLLFWVPEDCRHGLTCPAITTIPNTGRQRCVRIDFTHFQCGTSWTNVRGRNPRIGP